MENLREEKQRTEERLRQMEEQQRIQQRLFLDEAERKSHVSHSWMMN